MNSRILTNVLLLIVLASIIFIAVIQLRYDQKSSFQLIESEHESGVWTLLDKRTGEIRHFFMLDENFVPFARLKLADFDSAYSKMLIEKGIELIKQKGAKEISRKKKEGLIKIFQYNDRFYDVEVSEIEAFVNDSPGAKEVYFYTKNRKEYVVPVDEVEDFLSEIPDAKRIYE